MNAEEYQKVKEIFQSVLEIAPEGRLAFLDQRCDGENGLREGVERLLASYDSEFLKVPAGVDLTNGDSNHSSRSGQQIGHYTILEKIGSGGMGDVYLAEDGKLRRRVAIKFLSEALTNDPDRLHRFEQEAQTASALNHPNILTIHEIGETDNTHYIATEYIDGETLRAKLNRGRLTVDEALEIAIQCASALSAAHENGIIHRDIKPENIMLRRDNLVKVLDFGLAKLVEKKNVAVSHDALTEKHVKTAPGVIMGTVQYMSPEQTRGHATDARTDIWSFGCVLYEMVAGKSPFKGETSADLIAEIVKSFPIPVSQTADDIPERLDEIIGKALEKDPDERYQTAKDLLLDLKRLKRKLDVEAEVERSHSPATHSGRTPDSTAEAKTTFIHNDTEEGPKNTVSSAEYIVSGIGQHKIAAALSSVAVLLLIIAGTGIAFWYTGWGKIDKDAAPFASFDFEQITATGKSTAPAISPDGKFIAFFTLDVNKWNLVIRQVATGSDVQVIPTQITGYVPGIKFSKDGNYLYYILHNNLRGALYQVPSLGGPPRKIADDVDGGLTLSPDGNRLAFIRYGDKISFLMTANVDGSNPQVLLELAGEGSISDAAWAPDGKRLAVITQDEHGLGFSKNKLRTVSVETKAVEPWSEKVWINAVSPVWRSDGSGVMFTARATRFGPGVVWFLAYPSGNDRQITNDLNHYYVLDTTSDGRTLATERADSRTSIWTLDVKSAQSRQLTAERMENVGDRGIESMPEGTLLVTKRETDRTNLWLLSGDDLRTEIRLTDQKSSDRYPSRTPDGRYTVFSSSTDGRFTLWRMDANGQNTIQLTNPTVGIDQRPVVLGDNNTILFIRSTEGFETKVMKTTLTGGEPTEIFHEDNTAIQSVSVSPDGSSIALGAVSVRFNDEDDSRSSIRFLRFSEGTFSPLEKNLDTKALGGTLYECIWVDNKSLACTGSSDPANVYISDPLTGDFKKKSDFKDGYVWGLARSRDQKSLHVVRGFLNINIYLMKEKGQRSE